MNGTWKNVLENIQTTNLSLAQQIHDISEVTHALNQGDLSKKINVEANGEFLKLKNTINTMVDQLNSITSKVNRVVHEIGVEGRLGSQAIVCGTSGVWRDLVDNINLMADNLTDQVRSIVEVTTAVTQGDFTRYIDIDAYGEMNMLKTIINSLIMTLQETYFKKSIASDTNRIKREFVTNIAHDIRTYLSGVIGMTELALDTDLSPKQREYLKGAHTSSLSLLNIINDALDYRALVNGEIELERVKLPLRETVDDALKSLVEKADEAGIELISDIDPCIPDHLIGDPARLNQVITSLVGNAIKYTNHGEVVLRATVSYSSDAVELSFQISDTGIGMSEDMLQVVKEAFNGNKSAGTGLGLPISAKLIELMNGKIDAESTKGKGTVVYFTAQFGLEKVPNMFMFPDTTKIAGKKILIVDDNLTCCQVLVRLLKFWDIEAMCTQQGAEALQLITENDTTGKPFDCVLLDAAMPDMNGFMVAQIICSFDLVHPIPKIIMMTSAKDQEETLLDCVAKPVNSTALLDTLHNILCPSLLQLRDDQSKCEKEDIHILVVDGNLINQKVTTYIIENKFKYRVTAVFNGVEAMKAVQRQKFSIILMDMSPMEKMGGFEATRKIREFEDRLGIRTPIVALTARAIPGYLSNGIDECLHKPVSLTALYRVFTRFL
jgi:osomolarity two-component system sensor histidine kinase NIK1